jgi:prepilin-type N-terminal cleavage/methylation domain-containing protein
MQTQQRSSESYDGPACNSAPARVFRRRGVTLAEIVVVITIVAIVASICLPRYGSALARYRAKLAAKRLATDIELVQQTARSRGDKVVIEFDAMHDLYILRGITDSDRHTDDIIVDLSQRPYRADLMLGNAVDSRIVFDGYGMPSNGVTFQLSSGGYQQTVTLDYMTGEVQHP